MLTDQAFGQLDRAFDLAIGEEEQRRGGQQFAVVGIDRQHRVVIRGGVGEIAVGPGDPGGQVFAGADFLGQRGAGQCRVGEQAGRKARDQAREQRPIALVQSNSDHCFPSSFAGFGADRSPTAALP